VALQWPVKAPSNTSGSARGKCIPWNKSAWPAKTSVVYSHEMGLSVLELTVRVVISMNGLKMAAQDSPCSQSLGGSPSYSVTGTPENVAFCSTLQNGKLLWAMQPAVKVS
jgi:hypothetical protein